MKTKTFAGLLLLVLGASAAARADRRDRDADAEARPRDLVRLQAEVTNLDEALASLEEQRDERADSFRQRAEELKEEAVYLKVKMRHHRRAGRQGTGVTVGEVDELRDAVAQLADAIETATRRADRDVELPEGTEILLRLSAPLSSRSAQREDRVEATVFRPLAHQGRTVIPAGAEAVGVVRDVERARRPSRGGRLELEFTRIYLGRERLEVGTRVTSVDEDDTRDRARKGGIGAVLGGVLGSVLGGKKGAIIGAVVGGAGAVVATEGEDVEMPEGTIVRVRLSRPLTISASALGQRGQRPDRDQRDRRY